MNTLPFFRVHPRPVVIAAALIVMACPAALEGQDTEKFTERAKRAGEVLSELLSVPDRSPPEGLLREATCIAVVPGVVQAGLGIGGRAGFGVASCRHGAGWSAPTFVGLKGGSVGFQIGGQAADVVLVFVNQNAPRTIAASGFNIGGQVSVAAGPVGRNLSAETDYRARAEIYSYSKTKGLFAGISLAGTKWEIDTKANEEVYGSTLKRGDKDKNGIAALLSTDGASAPALLQPFLIALGKLVPEYSSP